MSDYAPAVAGLLLAVAGAAVVVGVMARERRRDALDGRPARHARRGGEVYDLATPAPLADVPLWRPLSTPPAGVRRPPSGSSW